MAFKTWQACALSAGGVACVLLLAGDRGATAQVGAAPDARWHVTTIERSGFEQSEQIRRDAILIDGVTGQTWIMTNMRGLEPAWEPVPKKGAARN